MQTKIKEIIHILSFIIIFFIFSNSFAVEKFSKKDVEKFVHEAILFAKNHGKEEALKEFSNPKGKFKRGNHGELYIYAYDFNGKVLAHGDKPKLVGINLLNLKDQSGIYPIKILINSLSTNNHWVKYDWFNPSSKKIEKKFGYCLKVDDTWWLGSGLYESEHSE